MIALFVIPMTLLGSFGSLAFKRASANTSAFHLIKSKSLYLGICLYGLASILHIFFLKYYDLSMVAPLMSLTYVWTLFISARHLKEAITKRKILGISLLLIGVILLCHR